MTFLDFLQGQNVKFSEHHPTPPPRPSPMTSREFSDFSNFTTFIHVCEEGGGLENNGSVHELLYPHITEMSQQVIFQCKVELTFSTTDE